MVLRRPGGTDDGGGLYSVAVHPGGARLPVYCAAEHATSTVWLLHGYDVAAVPGRELLARQVAETDMARKVLARLEVQRRAGERADHVRACLTAVSAC